MARSEQVRTDPRASGMDIKTIIRGHKLFEVHEPPMRSGFVGRHGRSTVTVTCPICERDTEVYLWSFAGSGKICDCGAHMGTWATIMEVGT